MLRINRIDPLVYSAFIMKKFTENSITIKDQVISQVICFTDGHTYYVQLLCNRISTVLRSLKSLLNMELIYFDYTPEGRKFYKINDLLFRRWAESRE